MPMAAIDAGKPHMDFVKFSMLLSRHKRLILGFVFVARILHFPRFHRTTAVKFQIKLSKSGDGTNRYCQL